MIKALRLSIEIYRKEVIIAKWSCTKTEDLFQIYWCILSFICFCLGQERKDQRLLPVNTVLPKRLRTQGKLSYGIIWTQSVFFFKWHQKVGKQLHPRLANFTPLAKRWFPWKEGQLSPVSVNILRDMQDVFEKCTFPSASSFPIITYSTQTSLYKYLVFFLQCKSFTMRKTSG